MVSLSAKSALQQLQLTDSTPQLWIINAVDCSVEENAFVHWNYKACLFCLQGIWRIKKRRSLKLNVHERSCRSWKSRWTPSPQREAPWWPRGGETVKLAGLVSPRAGRRHGSQRCQPPKSNINPAGWTAMTRTRQSLDGWRRHSRAIDLQPVFSLRFALCRGKWSQVSMETE